MNKNTVLVQARRQFVMRSTKASARLEQRVAPVEHIRSSKVEKFVDSLRVNP